MFRPDNNKCRSTTRQRIRAALIPAIYCRPPNIAGFSYGHFADDTAIITTDSDPAVASQILQTDLLAIQNWLKKWRMKANETKSTHVTFTT
jgi:hypothetical protein